MRSTVPFLTCRDEIDAGNRIAACRVGSGMSRAYMQIIRIASVVAVLVGALAWSGVAEARLARSKFSRLLAESELICRGRVIKVELDKVGRGHAVIEVVSVLKGTRPEGTILIEHSGEVHDMVIDVEGAERLLFLKRTGGKWTGTHYGRSYWWLVPAADAAIGPVTPVVHPITMLQFDGPHRRLLRPARLGPDAEATTGASSGTVPIEKMIALSAIEKAIADADRSKRRGTR
jgi:hypothetical protein